MNPMRFVSAAGTCTLLGLVLTTTAVDANAQTVTFSIDYRGNTIAVPDTGSFVPITEGDILGAATPNYVPAYGPLPPPVIVVSGGIGPPRPGLSIPLHPGCIGHPPGMPCGVEVDALSYGIGYALPPMATPAGTYVFSVDDCSVGLAAPLAPNVFTESPLGDAPADIFEDVGLPPMPMPPGPVLGNAGIVDGDGLTSPTGALYRGVGILEPTPPEPALPSGDDIDALDFDSPIVPIVVYFSLDAAFVNPCSGLPSTASAARNGFLPADVLVSPAPGAPPAVYAPSMMLGLGLRTTRSFGVSRPDDLDGLDVRMLPEPALPYCFGTVASCPCGFGGAPGHGCANSVFASGGLLTATGNASVAGDTVVLLGSDMPTSTALYFQGTQQVLQVFGDGLRCTLGNIIRLGIKFNSPLGTSQYPAAGDFPVSVRGLVPAAGATRFYQCWYRNAANFCTPATFNLTNGVAIIWTP
jgi:hypothetical protein